MMRTLLIFFACLAVAIAGAAGGDLGGSLANAFSTPLEPDKKLQLSCLLGFFLGLALFLGYVLIVAVTGNSNRGPKALLLVVLGGIPTALAGAGWAGYRMSQELLAESSSKDPMAPIAVPVMWGTALPIAILVGLIAGALLGGALGGLGGLMMGSRKAKNDPLETTRQQI